MRPKITKLSELVSILTFSVHENLSAHVGKFLGLIKKFKSTGTVQDDSLHIRILGAPLYVAKLMLVTKSIKILSEN